MFGLNACIKTLNWQNGGLHTTCCNHGICLYCNRLMCICNHKTIKLNNLRCDKLYIFYVFLAFFKVGGKQRSDTAFIRYLIFNWVSSSHCLRVVFLIFTNCMKLPTRYLWTIFRRFMLMPWTQLLVLYRLSERPSANCIMCYNLVRPTCLTNLLFNGKRETALWLFACWVFEFSCMLN